MSHRFPARRTQHPTRTANADVLRARATLHPPSYPSKRRTRRLGPCTRGRRPPASPQQHHGRWIVTDAASASGDSPDASPPYPRTRPGRRPPRHAGHRSRYPLSTSRPAPTSHAAEPLLPCAALYRWMEGQGASPRGRAIKPRSVPWRGPVDDNEPRQAGEDHQWVPSEGEVVSASFGRCTVTRHPEERRTPRLYPHGTSGRPVARGGAPQLCPGKLRKGLLQEQRGCGRFSVGSPELRDRR
ncbi:hypothetical protein DFH09DRAFT_372407 [Mycena vulgaris]|nr:hypothetical protein DFH09DRAFT_372407 [Mycena vulgaris]